MAKAEKPADVLSDLPRGQHARFIGTASQSYFEAPENLAATESLKMDLEHNPHGKILLGVTGGEIITQGRLPDGRLNKFIRGGNPLGILSDQHHTLIAGSRTGKGRSVLIPNLLCLPASSSVLSLDPKGELARITAHYRAEIIGQKVGVLDPFDVSGEETRPYRVSFNPLDLLDPADRKTFVPRCKLISDSLIVVGDFKDKHWDETSKQIATGLNAHVRTHERYEGIRDLVTVWQLASELATPDPHHQGEYLFQREMLQNDAAGGIIRNAARAFYDRTGGEFSSVLSNLRKHLDFLGLETMRDVLTGDSIDLKELATGSMTLYKAIPTMYAHDLRGWTRMIVQLALAMHEEFPKSGNPTIFMLDEFHTLGHLQCIETAIAQLAGMGAKLLVVLQDITQLQSKYEKSWETFLANSGVIQCFGLADQTTLEYISKALGETTVLTRSTNAPSFEQATQQAATGESWSLSNQRLLTPEEISRFFSRDDKMLRQLILRPGYRPAIIQKLYYDQYPTFQRRIHHA